MLLFIARMTAVVAAVVTVSLGLELTQAEESSHPPHAGRPAAALAASVDWRTIQSGEATAVADWLEKIGDAEALQAYLGALERAHRAVVRQQQQAPRPAPQPVGGTVGDCTGFAVPDYIIQRESGGNPSAYNASSGAYGCAQTLLSHYSGGTCSGLDPHTIDGQRECVNRLSNGGTNLAPWSTR